MKEKKMMKKILVMVMAVMVLFTMTSDTAEAAAPKKAVTVGVKNAKKVKGKYQLTVKKSGQLVVKYAGKNVTKKAKYKVSNKKVAAVSKKGRVTAKKAGSVTVTAKYKGKTKKVKFVVVKPTAAKKSGNSGSGSGGSSGGSTSSKHQHVWKTHKVEDKVWVSKMVEVPEYKTMMNDICRSCGEDFAVYYLTHTNEEGHEYYNNHMDNHIAKYLAGETEGNDDWGSYSNGYTTVRVGTKMEDHGYWKVTGSHVDYYYCSCGAKK